MPKQPADIQAARELSLYAVNDATIYRQKIQPIIKKLARKIKRGTYDAALAPKTWRYAADLAAIRYTCDFDANTTGPFGCFTPATRDLAAVEIAEHYAEELQETNHTRVSPLGSKDYDEIDNLKAINADLLTFAKAFLGTCPGKDYREWIPQDRLAKMARAAIAKARNT